MTLQRGNRIRRMGGEQPIRDVQNELISGGPTEAEIRQRAHEIYLSRAGAPGSDVIDWLQAETELRARRTKAGRD